MLQLKAGKRSIPMSFSERYVQGGWRSALPQLFNIERIESSEADTSLEKTFPAHYNKNN
jgi:hypothetical protein